MAVQPNTVLKNEAVLIYATFTGTGNKLAFPGSETKGHQHLCIGVSQLRVTQPDSLSPRCGHKREIDRAQKDKF